ncbi:hypothetical protein P8605_02820 [Streptomyces sp. T-3]|nr:hypothetical protein [Streptomyces sp. T-3]
MELDVQFAVPFVGRIHPDLAGTRERHLQWVRGHGLLADEGSAGRFLRGRTPEISAYYFPDATPADLDIVTDLSGFFFLFDDAYSASSDQPVGEVIGVYQDLIATLQDPTQTAASSSSPYVAMFADCWLRQCAGMSAHWRRRVTYEWSSYFFGCLTEISDARADVATSADGHMSVRRRSIGFSPTFAMAERVGHYEIPLLAFHSSTVQSMLALATDHTILVNEIYSLRREEARGELNLVHFVMKDGDCSRSAAIKHLVTTANDHITAYLEHERAVPGLCKQLGLSPAERDTVAHYIEALRYAVRGNLDWHTVAGRYQTADA